MFSHIHSNSCREYTISLTAERSQTVTRTQRSGAPSLISESFHLMTAALSHEIQQIFEDYERQRLIPPSFPVVSYLDAYASDIGASTVEVEQNRMLAHGLWQRVDTVNRSLRTTRMDQRRLKTYVGRRRALERPTAGLTERERRLWRHLENASEELDSELKELSRCLNDLTIQGAKPVADSLKKNSLDCADVQEVRSLQHLELPTIYSTRNLDIGRDSERPDTLRNNLVSGVQALTARPINGAQDTGRTREPLPTAPIPRVPEWFRILDENRLVPLQREVTLGRYNELQNLIWSLESQIQEEGKKDEEDEEDQIAVDVGGTTAKEKYEWFMGGIEEARATTLEDAKKVAMALMRVRREDVEVAVTAAFTA
ncbi:hypothetical protein GQ53DRAFT_807533 [Thozetella sp. PMI_491]|nr:hypothetical protein GQ53DRAFT_807533 [Thozetella sp. PMI_491]